MNSVHTQGKGALFALLLALTFFGMAPAAHGQLSLTNVLGFAKTADNVSESEGATFVTVVRKEGTRGMIQVDVELQKDASTNSINNWPTATNFVVTLRDNQLSTNVPVTIKDNASTNTTPTNSIIKFKLVNPRVFPGEDPSLTPTISTQFGAETLTLVNDDDPFTFSFSRINNSGTEGNTVTVRVKLAKSPSAAGATGVSVKYNIEPIGSNELAPGASIATISDPTANPPIVGDVEPVPPDAQTLDFGDNDTFKDIDIPLNPDSEVEFPEEFKVTLSAPQGSSSNPDTSVSYNVPSPAFARVRIINDAAATNAPVAAGSVDRTFNPENQPPFRLRNPGANGPVAAVVVDGQNNTYLAGAFTSINSNQRNGIGRINEWGQIDDTFKPTGANGAVSALQLITFGPDAGKVLIGGSFNAVNGLLYNGVARLNQDGSTDTTFQIGQGASDGAVYAIGVEDDGNIIVGGSFDNFNGISRGGVARLLPNGSVDTATFQGVDVNGPVFSVLIDPVTASPVDFEADITNAPTPIPDNVQSLNANNGVLLMVYNAYDDPDRVQILFGNKVVSDTVLTNDFQVLTDPNTGQTVTNWIPDILQVPLGLAAGKPNNVTIRVVTDPTNTVPVNLQYAARAFPLGTGAITIAGDFTQVNGVAVGGIARFTPNGILDTSFVANTGSGADASANTLARQSDGKLIVGGAFERFNNVPRGGITRLNPDGSQDLTFASGSGADQTIHSVYVDFDDTIYVAGEFTMFNGTPRNFLARLYENGTLDTTFMDNALNQFAGFPNLSGLAADGAQGYLASVAVGPDGNVVVGGLFAQVGGGATRIAMHPRQNFARLVGGSTRGPGNFQITTPDIPWDENGGAVPVSFERFGGDLGSARGLIATFDGAALAGQDYAPTNTIFSLAAGANPTVGATNGPPLNIGIIDDTKIEGNEDFFVDILGVDGVIDLGGEIVRPGVAFGTIPEAVVTIIENDTQPIFIGFSKKEFDVDEDDGQARIEVYRTGDPNQLVTVDYQVRVDTGTFAATPTFDFRTGTNTITFQPGQTNAFFNVTILDDELTENDETVALRLARPNFGAKLDPNATTATLNIIDNDLASGKVDFAAATYSVIEGQPYVDVQVRRAGGNVGLISVDYQTMEGSAFADEDYTPVSGTLTWNNQDISIKTIRIPIQDNDVVESDEQFSLQLSNPSIPGIIGNLHANPVVTIKDNDLYGQLSFSTTDFYADEDGANAVIQVVRRNGSADTVSVDYATTAGTAVVGTDYNNVSGTLTFLPGETAKTFVVPIADDTVLDTNKTVNLTLSNPVKATLGAQATSTLTILDNELLDIPAGDVEKDFAIGSGANGRVNALWLQNDGPTNTLRKIILAGDFTDYDRTPRQHVARVDDDGLVDARYANGLEIDGSVRTVLGTADGKLVIGGDFANVDGAPANHIARLNAVGRRDTLFDVGSGTDGAVNALAQTFVGTNRDSRIVVGGAFTVFNGVARSRIALVGEDAKVDTTFNPGVGPDLAVTAVAAQRDGKIIVGGLFNKISGDARRGIARLNLDGSVDTTFQPTVIGGTIRSIVIQADDKILIGGEIVSVDGVPRMAIARLNYDGTLDTSFDPGSGANGAVLSMALQADGKIIAVGAFTTFDNIGRSRITRLLPNGDQDFNINFGTGANDTIAAVAAQFDRKIVIGGDFTEVNGFQRNSFARLFGGSIIGSGRVEFFLSDYRVNESDGVATLVVKRSGGTDSRVTVDYASEPETASSGSDYEDVSGTLTFEPGESAKEIQVNIFDDNLAEDIETALVTLSNVTGATIGRQPIARVEIVSDDAVFSFSQPEYFVNEGVAGGQAAIKVIREGDLSFPVTVTVTLTNGTAVSPGDYTRTSTTLQFTPGETQKTFFVRVNDDNEGEGDETVLMHLTTSGGSALPGVANATLVIEDNDFHPGFLTFEAPSVIVDETNAVYTFEIRRTSGSQGPATVQVDTGGGTATEGLDYFGIHQIVNFTEGQTSAFVSITVTNDTKVEATETFEIRLSNPSGGALGSSPVLTVGIADDDVGPGSIDTTFDPGLGTDGPIFSMALQPDAKIAIAGEFLNLNTNSAVRIARLTPNGSADTNFSVGIGPNNTVRSIALADEGALTVGGAFRVFDAQDLLYFARVTTNGFLDPGLVAQPGLNAPVLVVTRHADTKALIGGQFTAPATHIGRVNASGQFDVSFNPIGGADGDVLDVQVGSDGKIYVGGDFNNLGGQPRGGIARLMSDGRVDLQFNTAVGADGIVRAVQPLGDGRVIIGGDFQHVNGVTAPHLARLNADGSLDTSFGADAPNGSVNAIDISTSGDIVIGGVFTAVGSAPRKGVANLTRDGALDNRYPVPVDVDGIVYDVEFQPDGKILVAGLFDTVNGFPRHNIARLLGARDEFPITSVSINASDLVIVFDSVGGATYEVQATRDFTSWTNVKTVIASGDTQQVSLPLTGDYQFFRVVKLGQ